MNCSNQHRSNRGRRNENAGYRQKNVRFAEPCEGRIVAESRESSYPLDESLWLNKQEWIEIRRQGQDVIDSIHKGDAIWSQARKLSYMATMSRIWRSCVKGKEITASLEMELRFWTCIGHSRRGLEKFTLSNIQAERHQRRRQHIEGVLFVQDQCWDNKMDFESSRRLVRVASEKLSKGATKFALMLAEADAHAVLQDTASGMAQTMVDELYVKLSPRNRTPSPPGAVGATKSVANAAA
jgi:hypothetical protein